jgi:hypothetical protein
MNNIKKTALALITMAAISANISRADDGAVAVPPPRPFANLVTDDEALEAWVHGNGPNDLYKPQLDFTFELPLNEIAKKIVLQFKNQFDLILPSDFDPATIMVKLELKNVNAIEIFNAMNMYFDTGNIPAHWKPPPRHRLSLQESIPCFPSRSYFIWITNPTSARHGLRPRFPGFCTTFKSRDTLRRMRVCRAAF